MTTNCKYRLLISHLCPVGPANWPGACTTGRKQSPINLNVTGNKVERAEPFRFHKYGNVPPTSFVGNKGKNVKFEIKDVAAKDMPQVRDFICNNRRCMFKYFLNAL